jgi:hypothetical protein
MGRSRSFIWIGLLLVLFLAVDACAVQWLDDSCAVCRAVQSSTADQPRPIFLPSPEPAFEAVVPAQNEAVPLSPVVHGLQARAPPV